MELCLSTLLWKEISHNKSCIILDKVPSTLVRVFGYILIPFLFGNSIIFMGGSFVEYRHVAVPTQQGDSPLWVSLAPRALLCTAI